MVKGIFKTLRVCALMVSLLAGSTTAFAQYVDWIGYGPGGEGRSRSNSAEGRRAAAYDSAGNVVVAGWVQNEPYANPLLVKYDATGTLLWQRRVTTNDDSYGRGVALDAAGNSILFAYSNNYPDLGFRLVKHSALGEQIWALRLRHESGRLHLSDIVVNAAGDFYVLGGTGEGEAYRAFVTRYSADGVVMWQTLLPVPGDGSLTLGGSALELDAVGNPYVCATMRPQQYVGAGLSIIQLSPSGTIGWQHNIGGALDCTDLGIDAQQRLVVASEAPEGLALYQFDLSGNQRWATTVASRFEYPDLALDALGDIAVVSRESITSPQLARIAGGNGQLKWMRTVATTSLRQRVNVDPVGNAYVVSFGYTGVAGARSAVSATKFDPSGAVVWSNELTAATAQTDGFWTSTITPSGNLLVLGDDREWPYQLLARQYRADGGLSWTGGVLPQPGLPQRAQPPEGSRYKPSLVRAGPGYFANSVVWNGDTWDCHVDSFSSDGALRWSRTEAAEEGEDCENIEIGAGAGGEHYIARFLPASCSITTNTREQFVLNRHDAAGQLQWQRTVWGCDDPRRPYYARLAVAADGSVYALGRAGQETDIVSYRSDGQENWRKRFALELDYSLNVPVRFDGYGNLVLAGLREGRVAVAKISGEGALLWQFEQAAQQGFVDTPTDLDIGQNGDIAVLLRRGEAGPLSYVSTIVHTLLLSDAGAKRWARLWVSPDPDRYAAQHVALDNDGNVTVTAAAVRQQADPSLRSSAAAIRYGRDGSVLWQQTFRYGEHAWPDLLAVDSAGNAWVGIYDYYPDIDHGNEHFTVTKLDIRGNPTWSHRFTDGSLGADYAHAALASADDALIIAASTNAHSSSDRLGLIRLSDLPRADAIFLDGFDSVLAPIGAQGATAPAR